MTAWPLLKRELRLRARQKTTYWWRFVAAGLAALVAVQSAMVYASSTGNPAVGGVTFTAIGWFGFILACLSVLATADSISAERREGTLGLLFLTQLTSLEVVLAKMTAAGLAMVTVLMALIPVLALAQLIGGVTAGSVARTSLALVNMLFVALCAGLFVSSRVQTRRKPLVKACWLILFLNVLPWCAAQGLVRYGGEILKLLSPWTSFHWASGTDYAVNRMAFWITLVIAHLEGWMLLAGAAICLSRNWRSMEITEADRRAELEPLHQVEVEAIRASRTALRQKDPVCWAVSRVRGHDGLIWGGAMLLLLLGGTGFSMESFLVGSWLIPGAMGLWNGLHMMLNFGAAAFLAWGAGRSFFNSQRSGAMELLLTTPLGAREIINGHWRALCLPLRGAWLLVGLLFALQFILRPETATIGGPILVHRLMTPMILVLDIIALCWVGMWFGLRSERAYSLIGWTVGLVIGLPWLITFLVDAIFISAGRSQWGPLGGGQGLLFWLVLSSLLFLAKNILLIRWAFCKLRRELKAAASLKTGEWVK